MVSRPLYLSAHPRLGPSNGNSRVQVAGLNIIDVPTLRCRWGSSNPITGSVDMAGLATGHFVSNTSMYCWSPPVDI